jgi:hypothetical protein
VKIKSIKKRNGFPVRLLGVISRTGTGKWYVGNKKVANKFILLFFLYASRVQWEY